MSNSMSPPQQVLPTQSDNSEPQNPPQPTIKLEVGITPDEKVLLNFGLTPICWLSFTVEQTESIITALQGCVNELKKKGE